MKRVSVFGNKDDLMQENMIGLPQFLFGILIVELHMYSAEESSVNYGIIDISSKKNTKTL